MSTNNNNKNGVWDLLGFVIIVMIVVSGVVAATRLSTTTKEDIEKQVVEIIKEKKILVTKPKCADSFESYLELKKKKQAIEILNNHKAYASNGYLIGAVEKTIKTGGKDDVSCGYLYIRASQKGKSLDEKYHSVYINPHNFGGHILRAKGIVYRTDDNFTEALIPLSSVSYLPGLPYDPDAKDYRIADWSKLLNVNSHVTFNVGLSVLNEPTAKIEEMTIAYKCWNPTTGEESSNCQLSLN